MTYQQHINAIAANIKVMRKSIGLTQTQLGERLGVGKTAIAKYESGDGQPSYRVLFAMCEVFGCTPNDLLAYSDLQLINLDNRLKSAKLSPENYTSVLKYAQFLLQSQFDDADYAEDE